MTHGELLALCEEAERLHAACESEDAWGKGRMSGIYFTPERGDGTPENYRNAALWCDDGDRLAEVHGNLGLGYHGDRFAAMLAHAARNYGVIAAELRRRLNP